MKIAIKLYVDSKQAEYTEYAERHFEDEGDMRDAYNNILDLLEDTEPPVDCLEPFGAAWVASKLEESQRGKR